MTHATTKKAKQLLAAAAVGSLLASPVALATSIDVTQGPTRGAASDSGSLSNAVGTQGRANVMAQFATQVQIAPEQATLFGAGGDSSAVRSAVPEPGTALLVGLGLLGVAAARRR
ncbi:MAG: PEP-CTERM sorting domain-containing protein [Pseudomonadota bacterium]